MKSMKNGKGDGNVNRLMFAARRIDLSASVSSARAAEPLPYRYQGWIGG